MQNLAENQSRISFDALPATFQDAVIIVRQLGVRYLWIDALCIIQDSADDWAIESAKMGTVYSRALLTIAAESSSDGSGGCFNQISQNQESYIGEKFSITNSLSDGTSSTLHIWVPWSVADPGTGPYTIIDDKLGRSPLTERGWVLQERILSPRTLHFTTKQLIWECRREYMAEDGIQHWNQWLKTASNLAIDLDGSGKDIAVFTEPLPDDITMRRAIERRLLWQWYNVVVRKGYATRSLTVADDKLPAIAGLARLFQERLPAAQYLAGMWISNEGADSIYALAWMTETWTVDDYRAPSFSWAVAERHVTWLRSHWFFEDCELPVIEAWDAVYPNQDRFGRVRSAWIQIRGLVRKVRLNDGQRGPVHSCPNAFLGVKDTVRNEFDSTTLKVSSRGFAIRDEDRAWIGEGFQDGDVYGVKEALCLRLGTKTISEINVDLVLVLGELDTDTQPPMYKRLGIGQLNSSVVDFPLWPHETQSILIF